MSSRLPSCNALPASLILTSREQKSYRKWQLQTLSKRPSRFGLLPDATEYAEFQAWLADRASIHSLPESYTVGSLECFYKRDPQTASKCGHPPHPAHRKARGEVEVEPCPVCAIKMHMQYMKLLTRAYERASGLVPQRWKAAPTNDPTFAAWHQGKLAAVREISRLEAQAQQETRWALGNPDSKIDASIQTAAQALQMYWAEVEGATERPGEVACTEIGRGKKEAKRIVRFHDDTCFTRGRSLFEFARKSPRYEPGKYALTASSEESDWDDETDEEDNDYYEINDDTNREDNNDHDGIDKDTDEESDDDSKANDEDEADDFFDDELEIETEFIVFAADDEA